VGRWSCACGQHEVATNTFKDNTICMVYGACRKPKAHVVVDQQSMCLLTDSVVLLCLLVVVGRPPCYLRR
jgi:hypothetical protein